MKRNANKPAAKPVAAGSFAHWVAFLDFAATGGMVENGDLAKLDEAFENGELTTLEHRKVAARLESMLG